MKGFFKEEIKKKPVKKSRLKKIGCDSCGLYKNCLSPKMQPTGEGKENILIIAEAPGKMEDEKGTQLIGQAGQLLRGILKKYNIDLNKDCWKTNAIICRPPKNRKPSNSEINACRSNLFKTIEKYKPFKIITLGAVALQSLIGHRTSVSGITKWTGWKIPDQDLQCWVFPTFHPSYILRNKDDFALKRKFEDHIKTAVQWDKDLPIYDIDNNIEIITNVEGACIFLEGLLIYKSGIAVDCETTGIKPHAKGHEILCMSICVDRNKSVCFPIFDDKQFKRLLRKVLQNEGIGKIAQNIKFEDVWTKEILGYSIKGWVWDTMVTSHILNNRSGITGLKFQTYVNYGVLNYDDKVQPYIKADSSNGFNNMKKCPQNDLLKYCAMDSLFTYWLFSDQQKELTGFEDKGNKLFLDGIIELAKVEQNGVRIDKEYYQLQDKHLSRKMERFEKKIQGSYQIKLWKKYKKEDKEFNHRSNKDLKELLFDVLKMKSIKKTVKGNPSTDEEALKQINIPITQDILQYRKLQKLKNTYLSNFISESVNNIIHPNFNLHIPKSFRSSANNPNFQNIPKRDIEAQRITRTGIIPREGNQLLEIDFKALEVCISACHHKDSEMIRYIENPDSDMHRDIAQEIFMKKDISRQERYLAKNQFVFPQFYGDYFVNCATNLWKNMEDDSKEFLNKLDVRNYNQFEKHIEKIEDRFWNEKFKVYTEWKKQTWRDYQKTGYVKLLTGFICKDDMKKNEVLNRSIQGCAFHCLLWSLIRLNQYLREQKFDSMIIGQIHDSMIIDTMPDELMDLKKLVRQVIYKELREEWKWIIVPLKVEAEISEVGGNWFEMKGVEI